MPPTILCVAEASTVSYRTARAQTATIDHLPFNDEHATLLTIVNRCRNNYSPLKRWDMIDKNYNLFAFQRIHKIAAKRA